MPLSARVQLRHNVRALLPGPESAIRQAVLDLGVATTQMQVLARYGAIEVLSIEGLRSDQTRVLERMVRDGGGEVVSSVDGTRAVVFAPLLTTGQLPSRLAAWSETAAEVGAAIGAVLLARGVPPPPVVVRGATLAFDERTLVMGVLNLTPDSFSGDGVADDVNAAVARGERLQADGADIIDVGAESTRPNSTPVDATEELRRLLPVLRALRDRVSVPLSVDTRKAAVASAALDEGAAIINDVWGLRADPGMASLLAKHPDCGVAVMHNQSGTEYTDLLADVTRVLRQSIAVAEQAGITASQVICDPGFGFAKTPAQNLELLRRFGELRSLGRPLLVGLSRKSTLGALLGGAPPQDRVEAGLAAATMAVAAGAHIVRTHDVAPTVSALRLADAVVRGTPEAVLQLPAPGPTG